MAEIHNLLVDEVVEYLINHPNEPVEAVFFHKFPALTARELDLVIKRMAPADLMPEVNGDG